jgi:hypothetical protein
MDYASIQGWTYSEMLAAERREHEAEIREREMGNYEKLTNKADDLLTVYANREDPTAGVFYRYDDGEEQNTPFQTADLPDSDEAAWHMVNGYVESM